jgi:sec-independent protein translocase protein TatB
MFDFAWTEIALIVVVALIAIGPKDLPVAIKAVTEMIKKARRMAGEFQTHVDDLVREANLGEVRDQINQIRSFDIKGTVERAVDPDGALRSTLSTNPLTPTPTTYDMPPPSEAAVGEHAETTIATPADADPLPAPDPVPVEVGVPAWLPPAMAPPAPAPMPVAEADAPAFIPPRFATRPTKH